MKHLDLFAGIGGFSLAAQELGIETVQFVEINPYCCHVLRKNFPTIPIHRDIRTFHAKPNQFDLITGGSPCQDLSIAGKRAGIAGSRSGLWFQMLRVIEEAKPRFVIWENVKGAISTGALLTVLSGLCKAGYCFDAEILSAAEIGLDHKRDRIFVVAHTDGIWWDAPPWREQIGHQIETARLAIARQSIESPVVMWLPTTEAAKYFSMTAKDLRKLLPELKPGKHYIDTAGKAAARGTYKFCVEELETFFGMPRHSRK